MYPEHCIWSVLFPLFLIRMLPLIVLLINRSPYRLFNLSTIALNKSFHENKNLVANGWKMSRMRFFFIAFSAMFVYYWLPGGLVQCISFFNWATWIKPESVMVSAVMGGVCEYS